MASVDGNGEVPGDVVAFSVERIRIDDEGGQCLISGADDEEEPAGYFIIEIDAVGATLEVLGEELIQRDGVSTVQVTDHRIDLALDPDSDVGRRVPRLRITSREPIGTAVRAALRRAFGTRLTED